MRKWFPLLVIAAFLASAAVVDGEGLAAVSGVSVTGSGAGSLEDEELRRLVDAVSREHGIDPRLVDALVRVESGYDPRAVSHKGAMGLMQLMPETVERLDIEDPFDPEENVRAGVREISRLVDRYSGNLQLALAAYNAGEGAVARYRGVPPFHETRTYVSRILTIYTGRPYRLAAAYRSPPVRMLQDGDGNTVITNLSDSEKRASQLGLADVRSSGPLRGGFGQRQ